MTQSIQIRNISEVSTDSAGTVLASYEYTIGANNERLTCTELNRTVEYEYDELERLVSETVTTGSTVSVTTYTYDANSNRVSMDKDGEVTTYEYNALNQLVRAGDVEYTWDNAGNLVSQTTTSGVIVSTYTYDSYNRMVSASVNSNNGTLEQEYTYDYLGNRTSKTTDGVTTYYVTDLSSGYSQVLKLTTGSDVIYYTRGFELISRNEGTEASYYLYDGGMSVRGITDEAGTLTDTYVFDAFGNEVARTGTTENSYGYRGEEQDETGLYYLRARYMDPSTGTFTTMDTYGGRLSDPMSLHKYMYANSNPVKYCDPSGHMSLVGCMAVGAIIGGLVAANCYFLYLNLNYDNGARFDPLWFAVIVVIGIIVGMLIGLLIYHIFFASSAAVVEYGDAVGKMGTYVEHPGIKVDWSLYADHGTKQMIKRGITKEMVNYYVEYGKALLQSSGKYAFVTREGVAVVTELGRLVTAWTAADFDDGMLEVIKLLFGG